MKTAKQANQTTEGARRGPFIQRQCSHCAEEQEEETPFISSSRVGRLQTKLAVGQPGDQYEREADQMADYVMRMPMERATRPLVSRISHVQPNLQRSCTDCEAGLIAQRKATRDAGGTHVSPDFSNRLQRRSDRGEALPPNTQTDMGSIFGADFRGVRIHRDSDAVQMSQELNAQAFTHGSDVYFNQGKYDPSSNLGRELLAHELTHIVQQSQLRDAQLVVQRVPTGPQVIGGRWREPKSLFIPDMNIIPDILDATTLAVGLSLARALTPAERRILQPVFGPHLDYSLIRICNHQLCSPDGIARTVGNLIAAPPEGINNSTLVHESAHVWQHQNGIRYSYITSALLAQFGAWLYTGSRNAAYDWHIYYDNSVPWAAWNAEAQAQYICDNMTLPPWYIWGTGGFLPVP